MAEGRRVALALGAGGARGYAHIGAIQVLEERGYEIVSVAGSSMGALVGGLHAAGKLESYAEWATSLSQLDVLRMLDLSLSAPGAIRAERILARVRELTGDELIEDLPVPYTAVATDLLSGREVWFQRGPLDVAIRASIALPGIFTPVALNGRVLVDGGLMNPVPITPTAAVAADLTIAIGLTGERADAPQAAPAHETSEPRPLDEWVDRFRRRAAQAMDSDVARALMARLPAAEPGDEIAEDATAGLTKLEVMTQSLEAMQRLVTRYRLAGNPPDLLVTVPKDACRTLDFHRAGDLIALGRQLTEHALDDA